MQNEALLLLGAAVMYSEEAHTVTLAAFKSLKQERRPIHAATDQRDSVDRPLLSR